MDNDENKFTIYMLLEKLSKSIPNREMIVFPETGERYTYYDFNKRVNGVCRSLIAMGVVKGSHVGLWMDNIFEWYVLFYAINKIGGIVVPINTSFKSVEMDMVLKNFDIDYLFMTLGYDKKYPLYIKKIIPNMNISYKKYPRLKNIISIDFYSDSFVSYYSFLNIGNNLCVNDVDNYFVNTFSDDVCVILPTSGTTGMPKGVMLTNFQLIKNGFDIGERYGLTGEDKMLIQVPMFHCFGLTLSMLASLTHCTSMCVISHFNSSVSLAAIERERVTCINGVPTMYSAILNDSSFSRDRVKSLKKGIMAGSNCLPDFMKLISEVFDMKLISVYGLSEASPGCTMSSVYDDEEVRYNTVGSSLGDIECEIVDFKGNKCDAYEKGEFIVRGYNVMKGYYNDCSITDCIIDSNGFLHTGDIAMKRVDGNYVITGRIKDTIIRGGENIYPREVSMILNSCPGVMDSCVFGVDSCKFGQEVAACIITNGYIDIEFVRSYMKDKCAGYKIPKYIMIVDDFIKNAAGKVMTNEMVKVYSKKIKLIN